MNTVEDRLRAAARDAARAFTAGEDLPPLRLPGAAAGHGGRRTRGRARTGHARAARAWLTPLAAAAAVAVVAGAIVVLHQVAAPSATRPGGTDQAGKKGARAPAGLRAQHRAQLVLDALVVEAVAPATGPQYDRGSKLIWLVRGQELRATARCMARWGYHISAEPAPFNLATFADNSQMPDLPRIASTHEFVSGSGAAQTSYSKAEQKAYRTCGAVASVPFKRLMSLDEALNNSWWKIAFRIQASRPVQAAIPALNRCAARYGFPNDPYGNASAPMRNFGDFMDWVAGFLDGAGSRGVSGSKIRALDQHWSTVFVTCAQPIVRVWQRLQLTAQPGFLAAHAAQVRQLDQLVWQRFGRDGSR
jgi:hypothetical protein